MQPVEPADGQKGNFHLYGIPCSLRSSSRGQIQDVNGYFAKNECEHRWSASPGSPRVWLCHGGLQFLQTLPASWPRGVALRLQTKVSPEYWKPLCASSPDMKFWLLAVWQWKRVCGRFALDLCSLSRLSCWGQELRLPFPGAGSEKSLGYLSRAVYHSPEASGSEILLTTPGSVLHIVT